MRKHKHIHKIHAYVYIVIAIGVSIWLVSVANPNKVNADDNITLNQLITEKDSVAEMELLKPNVVMETDSIEDSKLPSPLWGEGAQRAGEVVILPSGPHQSTKTQITIIFPNIINLDSFKNSFSIIPNVAGKFSINKNIGTFIPDNDLAPQTKYQIQIAGDIITTNVFETRADTHILVVPYYRQQYSRSCEAASLRMALAYLGTVSDDKEIVNLAGYNPREPDWVKNVWDDPYKMFVGFLDGKQVGYGMYASALAKSSSALGHSSRVLKNPTSQDIAQAIWNDQPVVAWGYIKNTVPQLSYFKTISGKRIPIYSNEHARTIVGVVGSPENPVGFYIHDPLSGLANEYWIADDLSKHMSIFGAVSNQVLIIE
ncbi:hypothetical protein A3C57_00035 [Candidatus Nomurabacteria bacterium RIFCSPHIGHO2_02_FULL_33_12]|uniref:Peptidase C39-like domain-containing protein n=1 Tax=Candidatus Nomurabacteria bacterium RIFCSPLOWO2_01_FULL_33_17 TaxID=1801764 RepID=A0A1F6WQU4_9BACT|nr:MAG: hypothetical protein A3C57_00035 [Candidatus Nomurabacteria bacterium RIFCSPHIGHO2_02_FULL_33_12]OGI84243.1 MAG: hypothetical protein A2903_02425 [Candidatus Nomurabacteria bacterium RIFCSPLOWO2_01_FULL_33_17]